MLYEARDVCRERPVDRVVARRFAREPLERRRIPVVAERRPSVVEAAALWLLADAASEGKKVVLSMLVVGLIFLAVILLGDLSHYTSARRRRNKLDRPL